MANARETLCEAVRTQLEERVIPGGVYEYPPSAVYRQTFMPEGFNPDATHAVQGVYYVWSPADGWAEFGPSSCTISGHVGINVRAYKKLKNLTENPSGGNDPERWQYQNAMFEDICRACFADIYFGGAATRIVDLRIEGDWSIQDEAYAIVEARFAVEYQIARPE